MIMCDNDLMHLVLYKDRSVLFNSDGRREEFLEGSQDQDTVDNFTKIKKELDNGYLERLLSNVHDFDFSLLDAGTKLLIDSMVAKVTSEVGRALVGLSFLQLTIKSIVPSQSVRLHKGSVRKGAFSWVKGISMRTLDNTYNTPFLRKHNLLNINKDGIMMTRSLAENYPYSLLYKAEMRGPFHEWIEVVDGLEYGKVEPLPALNYLLSVLINRSSQIEELGNEACRLVRNVKDVSFADCKDALFGFFETTKYSARAFEVVIHGFMQAYIELGLTDLELVPMSQMRSANKKHHNVGDVELKEGRLIVEAWDAKFGKPYLYEELDELRDKLESHDGVRLAGFIVDKGVVRKEDVEERIQEVSFEEGVDVRIFDFDEWVEFKTEGLDEECLDVLGRRWVVAVVETFARKRLEYAPIDEPCDEWLRDIIKMLEEKFS